MKKTSLDLPLAFLLHKYNKIQKKNNTSVVTTLIKGQKPNRRQQLQRKYKPSEIDMKILHFQPGMRKKLPTYVALIIRVNANAKTSPLC